MAADNLDVRLACPLCGAPNKRSSMQCVDCGEWLPWAAGLPMQHRLEDTEPNLPLILISLLLPPLGLLLCAVFSFKAPGRARQAGVSACLGLAFLLAFYFVHTAL